MWPERPLASPPSTGVRSLAERRSLPRTSSGVTLLYATQASDGAALALDGLVFDNAPAVSAKCLDMHRIHVCPERRFVAAGLGSVHVVREGIRFLQAASGDIDEALLRGPLAEHWRKSVSEWMEERSRPDEEGQPTYLREPSRSLLVILQQDEPRSLWILDPEGDLHSAETYVLSGSASPFVRPYIKEHESIFQPTVPLHEQLPRIVEMFRIARSDLFVSGLPSVVVVTPERIINHSDAIEQLWRKHDDALYASLTDLVVEQHSSEPRSD